MRSLLCTGRKRIRRKFLILDFLKRGTLHVSDHEMLLPFLCNIWREDLLNSSLILWLYSLSNFIFPCFKLIIIHHWQNSPIIFKPKIERFSWPWNENARTKQKQQRIGLSKGYKRAWLLVGWANARVKRLHALELSRNQSILRFDVILQHDWPIEQCLLHISVFFGGKTKLLYFELFIHWLTKTKITNTDRNHFASPYENRSNRLNHNKHILAANLLIHLFEYESESCDHGFRSDVRVLTRHEPSCELSFQCQLNFCHLSCQISVQFMYHFTWRKQDPSSRKIPYEANNFNSWPDCIKNFRSAAGQGSL